MVTKQSTNKSKKACYVPTRLLKGASLDKHNQQINELLSLNGISEKIEFKISQLQVHINQEKSFARGLLKYLQELKHRLDLFNVNQQLKLQIFQMLSELGSLVFPNTNSCYSVIPADLKKIQWPSVLTSHNQGSFSEIGPLISKFEHSGYHTSMMCLISLGLCDLLLHVDDNSNQLLVDDQGYLVTKDKIQAPRLKASAWLNRMQYLVCNHLDGLANQNNIALNGKAYIQIQQYSEHLTALITKTLTDHELLLSYNTIANEAKLKNKVIYLVWNGSNLLALPKTLTLPMVCPPASWDVGTLGGGYLLSSLTNISYQGYLDNKAHRVHNHHLQPKTMNQINRLQSVRFCVNQPMLDFVIKNKHALTEAGVMLLTNKWIGPEDKTPIVEKWKGAFGSARQYNYQVWGELTALRNKTFRDQEILNIAEFYRNLPLYWPAVQDFRGRIYRIGNLNPQLDTFVRSLITFYSHAPKVKRRKQSKKTLAQFYNLLEAVLVSENLINKWDDIFGNRLIDNEQFQALLLRDLVENQLTLIQVSQLLLIRQGAYDQVGVFYDATASAYQIMGVLTANTGLCQSTNVLNIAGSNTKQDIYQTFLDYLKHCLWNDPWIKQFGFDKQETEFLKNKFNRNLIKAIVMPLIYGKTALGFSQDLQDFFKHEGKLVTVKASSTLLFANAVIRNLKTHPALTTAVEFMAAMRAFASLLLSCDSLNIESVYCNCFIRYNKEHINRIRLYMKTKKGYRSKRVSISTIVRDDSGGPVRSGTKAVNAFIANYVHFLDGYICHYVIDQLAHETLPLATIHDSFFIQPENADALNSYYREGLIQILFVHQKNILRWLYILINKSPCKSQSIKTELSKALFLELNNISSTKPFDWASVLRSLQRYKRVCNNKAKWTLIINYIERMHNTDYSAFVKSLLENPVKSLFEDN